MTSAAGEIVSLAVTSNGALWYASRWHLYRYESGEGTTYAAGQDFPGTTINTVACGPDNRIWAGTDKGASVFDGERWISYSAKDCLAGADIRSISFDAGGNVWFGTNGGVSVFSGETWRFLTVSEGLTNNRATAVAFDPDSGVWIGTEDGITRLIPGQVAVKTKTPFHAPFAIQGNYPNPFNPSTNLSYTLSQAGRIDLSVYSVTGQRVRTLVQGHLAAGAHSVLWDGRDNTGNQASSGVYIALLRAGKLATARRMALIR